MANYNSVTEDEIERTKKYKEAIDQLQNSVTGLNSKLPSFADGLKAGLQGIGEKLPEVVQSMVDLNKQNKELAESGGKPVSVLKQLATSMFSWNTIVSIGVTLLSTYGDAIIDWVSDLFKGETKLTAFGKAMKETAIITDALTQAKLRGAQSAQGELTALDVLYRASQNQKLSLEERKKAMVALRDQWPATFRGLDDEAFKTAKAADAYKNLKAQILDAAYAEAYKNKITANASRSIDDDLLITKERENNVKLVKELQFAQSILKNYKPSLDMGTGYKFYADAIDRAQEKLDASDKIINNFNTDKNILNQQNNKFASEIDKLTQKKNNGVSILTRNNQNNIPPETDGRNGKNNKPATDLTTQIAEESAIIFNGLSNRITVINAHYDKLKAHSKQSKKELLKIEEQHQQALAETVAKFQTEDAPMLAAHEHKLAQIAIDATQDAKQKALLQAELDKKDKLAEFDKDQDELRSKYEEKQKQLEELQKTGTAAQVKIVQDLIIREQALYDKGAQTRISYEAQLNKKIDEIKNGGEPAGQPVAQSQKSPQQQNDEAVQNLEENGRHIKALQLQQTFFDAEYKITLAAAKKKGEDTTKIETDYAKKKIAAEQQLISAKIHAGDKFINAVLANTKKDSAIYKAAFLAKKATAVADTIISTKQAVLDSLKAYSGIPFIGQALGIAQAAFMAVQGATSIATIIKQKPGFAQGGQYLSDGRGAVLSGYSRTDNTNAYLRSGEAVVVSEAMRNPWARNLVSAINVAHGGRDFSVANPGRGYAVGGIFTDGGNANRYYNQPVNDIKDMANTLAYQMINNFPPIYVDVKDVNNQQNILAQTVNRVNL
jgi:hypothetical protein